MSPWPSTSRRSDDGTLTVGGCDVRDLAAEHGTPLYVLDEHDMRTRARAFRDEFGRAFQAHGARCEVFYAGKALLCSEVARWMHEDGLGLDVASGGELEIALRAGFPPEKIAMHGNNKSVQELTRALEVGVGRIVVDSLTEIALLEEIATRQGSPAQILVRVTTGVHAGGHEYIATAHEDQKFGLSLASGEAMKALTLAHESAALDVMGIHTHIGSQILSIEAFRESAHRMLALRSEFALATGHELPEVDLGGGYAIAYLDEDESLTPGRAAPAIADVIADVMTSVGGQWPTFSIEPGRAIAGPAGITLYEVGVTKDASLDDGGTRRYIAVDGGMSDNMRPVTYGANYSAQLASRESLAPPILSRVVGKHCESGDIVVREAHLPEDISRGDLLAVAATGAYGRSMSNNYNALLRPAVVAVHEGASRVIVRRDTLADLFRSDVGPEEFQ